MDADLDIHCGVTVGGLARDSGGWRLRFADGRADQGYDRVLLTVPTPQALPLLADAGIAPGPLAAVRYQPNWTLMWTPAVPLPDHYVAEPGALGDPIAWLARGPESPAALARHG